MNETGTLFLHANSDKDCVFRTVRCQELLEHWRACGISMEQGLYVLKVKLIEYY